MIGFISVWIVDLYSYYATKDSKMPAEMFISRILDCGHYICGPLEALKHISVCPVCESQVSGDYRLLIECDKDKYNALWDEERQQWLIRQKWYRIKPSQVTEIMGLVGLEGWAIKEEKDNILLELGHDRRYWLKPEELEFLRETLD